jgi:hypothetical protein
MNMRMIRGLLLKIMTNAEQARIFLKILPDAFNVTYVGRQGDLVEFDFKPNPNFRPPNREARVFHAMEGSMSINVKDNRLAAIGGKLMQEVKFGGGFLGVLDKGGRFAFRQQEMPPALGHDVARRGDARQSALFQDHQCAGQRDSELLPARAGQSHS